MALIMADKGINRIPRHPFPDTPPAPAVESSEQYSTENFGRFLLLMKRRCRWYGPGSTMRKSGRVLGRKGPFPIANTVDGTNPSWMIHRSAFS